MKLKAAPTFEVAEAALVIVGAPLSSNDDGSPGGQVHPARQVAPVRACPERRGAVGSRVPVGHRDRDLERRSPVLVMVTDAVGLSGAHVAGGGAGPGALVGQDGGDLAFGQLHVGSEGTEVAVVVGQQRVEDRVQRAVTGGVWRGGHAAGGGAGRGRAQSAQVSGLAAHVASVQPGRIPMMLVWCT